MTRQQLSPRTFLSLTEPVGDQLDTISARPFQKLLISIEISLLGGEMRANIHLLVGYRLELARYCGKEESNTLALA